MSETSQEIKIAVLEEKFSVTTRAIDRIDSAIEKIAETNQHILKMLALHDEKIANSEKSEKNTLGEIDEIRIGCSVIKEQMEKRIDIIDEKIAELIKIKWMTIGMATLIVILIGAITQLAGGILNQSDEPEPHHSALLK